MEIGFSRRNIGRLVLLGWAVALAWLARRQFSQGDSADTAARTRRLAPGAQYYAVYAGARQIGQLNLSVDTLVNGVRLTELMVLDLAPRFGAWMGWSPTFTWSATWPRQTRWMSQYPIGPPLLSQVCSTKRRFASSPRLGRDGRTRR